MYRRKLFLLLPVQQVTLYIWQIHDLYILNISTKHVTEPLILIIFIWKEDCIVDRWANHILLLAMMYLW